MKNAFLYKIPIFYMLIYALAIVLTGVWLFLLSNGLEADGIAATLLNFIEAPQSKSMYGVLEVATPHMVSIGMLIFLVAHFLLFSTTVSKRFSKKASIFLYLAALANICAYFFMAFGWVQGGWFKLLLMAVFVLLFVFVLALVALSLFSNHSKVTSPSKLP